ncbi:MULTISPECIES: hypothetical protein [unclassified Mesorhizobium]|nr:MULTISPECIES: hypothetical protein [unclassified Mesorhizobium]
MPAAIFRQVLEEKQFRGGDAKPLINAAAMFLTVPTVMLSR